MRIPLEVAVDVAYALTKRSPAIQFVLKGIVEFRTSVNGCYQIKHIPQCKHAKRNTLLHR